MGMKFERDGAAVAVVHSILCGLHMQVGAIYRAHEPGRDSSREKNIGPRNFPVNVPGSDRPG